MLANVSAGCPILLIGGIGHSTFQSTRPRGALSVRLCTHDHRRERLRHAAGRAVAVSLLGDIGGALVAVRSTRPRPAQGEARRRYFSANPTCRPQ